MSRKNAWSEDEDRVILDQIRRNTDNLSRGFRKAAELLENRSLAAIKGRWYLFLSKQSNNICFATLSNNTKVANRKVLRKEQGADNDIDTPVIDRWWNRLLAFLTR